MEGHFHTGFDMFAFVVFSSWIGLALMRMIAAWLAAKTGAVGSLGAALGGTL